MNLKQLIKFGMEESQEPVIKNPILRQALEPRSMDLADGGRIGFDPGGKVKGESGTTKNVSSPYLLPTPSIGS